MNPPSFLFLALVEYDVERLTVEGVTGEAGEGVVLYEEVESAQEALPAAAGCLVMIQAERMLEEGHEFVELGAGLWAVAAVPPKFLWISEQ